MEKKSINLCRETGKDALEYLAMKVSRPEMPLSIGKTAIDRIMAVEHYGDALPVFTVITTGDNRVIFQFNEGHAPFSDTAMDSDGQMLCSEDC